MRRPALAVSPDVLTVILADWATLGRTVRVIGIWCELNAASLAQERRHARFSSCVDVAGRWPRIGRAGALTIIAGTSV
jgi:hypothetical protein